MNKFFNRLVIAVFILILVVPTIGWNIFGDFNNSSLDEKRDLADFPKELNDDYLKNIRNWYTDNAPYRNTILTTYQKCYSSLNRSYRKNIKPILSSLLKPSWVNEGEEYLAPEIDNQVIYGKDDWLFYAGDEGELFYTGDNVLSEYEMDNYLDLLTQLNNKCLEKGISFTLLIAPNKENVYEEYMPTYNVKDIKREEVFVNYIKEHSDVNVIYPLAELKKARNFMPTYYKQDTHWNEFGGLVGLNEINKTIGHEQIDYNTIIKQPYVKYGGDLSSMCGQYSYYEEYYIDYESDINEKLMECNDNSAIEKYISNNSTSEKLVLIGDSFRDNIKKLIAKDFCETNVFHRNYVEEDKCKQAIQDLKAGDKLIILIVERYDDKLLKFVDPLINYFN